MDLVGKAAENAKSPALILGVVNTAGLGLLFKRLEDVRNSVEKLSQDVGSVKSDMIKLRKEMTLVQSQDEQRQEAVKQINGKIQDLSFSLTETERELSGAIENICTPDTYMTQRESPVNYHRARIPDAIKGGSYQAREDSATPLSYIKDRRNQPQSKVQSSLTEDDLLDL